MSKAKAKPTPKKPVKKPSASRSLVMVGNVCFVALVCIALVVASIFVYYHFFVHDDTIGVNNIGDQIALDVVKSDELLQEEQDKYAERWFIEANYYSNDKNNGIELQEVKYNYFTSYRLLETDYRSTGMQFLGDFSTYFATANGDSEVASRVLEEFCYYDTTNEITWKGYKGKTGSIATVLNRDAKIVIKIDNRPFEIQLTGSYEIYERLLGFLWYVNIYTAFYDYGDLFDCIFTAVKTNNQGYGDYYITIDLSQFFTIKEYDPATGKYKADDVTDIIKNYALIKFSYYENGARNSSQSLFGIINCDPKYDLETGIDTTYWQERVLYNLSDTSKIYGQDALLYQYSEAYDGYFVSINPAVTALFADMPRAKVNIIIDTTLANKKVVGIDYNGFTGLTLDTLQIIGTGKLYLRNQCFYDTHLQTLKRSADMQIIELSPAFNNEYSEVIV